MFTLDIPGRGTLDLKYIVSDYNGTLACDGILLPDLADLIRAVSEVLEIHVITADTFGIAKENLADLPVKLTILPKENQDVAKAEYVRSLGCDSVAAMGNGRNDAVMLGEAALGICLIQTEGANSRTLQESDIVCGSARDALELFLNPKRLTATLRR